jgi:hypothetical protein
MGTFSTSENLITYSCSFFKLNPLEELEELASNIEITIEEKAKSKEFFIQSVINYNCIENQHNKFYLTGGK